MPLLLILLAVLPLIAFVVLDAIAGLKTGVISAIILSLLSFIASFFLVHPWDPSTLLEPILILALGLVTLRTSDRRYFRYQPVVVNLGTAAILGGFHLFSQPLLVKYALPLFETLTPQLPPSVQPMFSGPGFALRLSSLDAHLAAALVVHAGLVAWTAHRPSNVPWILAKLSMYPIAFILVAFDLAPR